MAQPRQPAHITFGWKKIILFSLLPTVFLFGLLEIGARTVEIWIPPWTVDFGWGFNPDSRLFIPSKQQRGVMVVDPAKKANFITAQRFSMPKRPGAFRVFVLGGSSVNLLDDELVRLASRLCQASQNLGGDLTFEVLNAGGNSYGSHRLVVLALEILRYEPDLVLIYSGHNEFTEVEQLDLACLDTLALQKLMYKSALCRFIRDRIASFQVSRLQREKNRRILANSDPYSLLPLTALHTFTMEEMAERMEAFRNNLARIISLCKSRGVPVIIGTIPSNLVEPVLPDDRCRAIRALYEEEEYEKGAALVREILRTFPGRIQSSDQENAIIRSLAAEFDIPLADVEAAIIEAEPHHVPGETLFDDMCHLNAEGNRILIDTYEVLIVKLLKDKPGRGF